MPDIVTLTINPAIDIFVNVDHVEPTRKMRCSAPKRDPGGGGINVARVAHRLGSDVAAIYPIGGALGKLLQRLLEREGIASLVTPSHVETRENFTAYEEETGAQFRFVLPGSPLNRAEWQTILDRLEGFASLFGADFYGLPRNGDKVTLEREPWIVPSEYPFGEHRVVPLRAGEKVYWRVRSAAA